VAVSAPRLSIVIPAYNEARRIRQTLHALRDYARARALICELIVVDDGSADSTAAVVESTDVAPATLVMLRLPRNRGKGAAVREGMLAAGGELLLLCDADQSVPIAELERLLPWLERGFDVVIGSRDLPDSRLDPPQPLLRRLMAWVFRAVRRRLLLPAIRDTQCGFKLFRRAAAREVFASAREDGWLFDCEILALAQARGYCIREVGVTWRDVPASRVRPLREAVRALCGLVRIRRRLR
jgi:dolichyl-phosphate beta-glucosyltransferase